MFTPSHYIPYRCSHLEEDLSALRDKSRQLLEEADAKVERLQAALRQQQQVGGANSGSYSRGGAAGIGGGGPSAELLMTTGVIPSEVSVSGSSSLHVEELQRQVDQYRLAYEDSERTHQLRDQTESALKEEVAKQQVRDGGMGGPVRWVEDLTRR